ncbi:putative ribonuclease H-like domain-containing protein [Tanacetum coccineum]
MADNRTMAQLIQAPTEGYEDAIVIPEINVNFELKHGLINLVQNKQFFGHDKEDPHAHIRYFNKITSTNEIPKHTFYNALNANDQDSLNSAAGGNFLDKMPRECLRIIESKSNVRNSRNKAVVAKVSSDSSTPGILPDVAAFTTETAVKTILKYLRNIKDIIFVYDGNPKAELRVDCYCNAGFETNRDDIKSQTGYVSILNRGALDWKSSKQKDNSNDWAFKVFIVILLGFPGPSDGLRLLAIVFFSSGSGLTADSSVLTLTLDETGSILRNLITEIENLKDLKVKIIRCDNGGEFKNREMDELCTKKGIKKEFSNARTPQQNGVAERRNSTLIEAARTMLANAKLPITFWAVKSPAIGFLRPFGCHVMILNTLNHLGKFDTKGDEGTYSTNISGTKEDVNQAGKDNVSSLRFIALPNLFHDAHMETSNDSVRNSEVNDDPQKEQDGTIDVSESSGNTNPTASSKDSLANQVEHVLSPTVESEVPTVSSPVPTVSTNVLDSKSPKLPIISRGGSTLLDTVISNVIGVFFWGNTTNSTSLTEVEADISNMETDIQVSPTPTLRINKDHPKSQIIGTRHKAKNVEEQSFIATIHQKTNPDILQYCLFSCFLSQAEPKKIVDALKDES